MFCSIFPPFLLSPHFHFNFIRAVQCIKWQKREASGCISNKLLNLDSSLAKQKNSKAARDLDIKLVSQNKTNNRPTPRIDERLGELMVKIWGVFHTLFIG